MDKNKTLVVCKNGHSFIRVFMGDRLMRLHVKPDGKWNIQYNEQIASKKVVTKGDMSIAFVPVVA